MIEPRLDPPRLGSRLRALRATHGLSQKQLAERLGVSASYLNLIEHDRRPLTADLLLRLARTLDTDLRSFGSEEGQLAAELCEVLSDPVFESHPLTTADIRAAVSAHPDFARALRHLHERFVAARESLDALGAQLLDAQTEWGGSDRTRLASEQVSDFIERHTNYFPALEAEAERVRQDGRIDDADLYGQLSRYLARTHGVSVRIRTVEEMGRAVRRYDADRRELHLSEILRRGSRNFQLAVQTGLLDCAETLDQLTRDPALTSDSARSLGRVALASYFAGAVLMPYAKFLAAAERERYDIELLGHRFRVGWEQTCHRLTTLRRPGAEGVSFYLLRVDQAGNISKRFSAAGVRFPRFSGLCTLWNVHGAFAQPGRVRVQLSQLPDGQTVLAVARTVRRDVGSYHSPEVLYSVGVGCSAADAPRLVYADAINLETLAAAVPIGITCRLCERSDCTARAFPSIRTPLAIDENTRGISFFAPVTPRQP
jgi:predicted transcriptional regulator/DNA-binding XRE family transcriptional regulator